MYSLVRHIFYAMRHEHSLRPLSTITLDSLSRVPVCRYATNDTSEDAYDIVISGGGMVGCALASALGHEPALNHLKILLLESSDKNPDHGLSAVFSNRVCALSPATKTLLTGIGAWEQIESRRLQPVDYMQVWECTSDSSISFRSEDDDGEHLAYIVENDVILKSIEDTLSKCSGDITVQFGAKAQSIDIPEAVDDSFDSPYIKLKLNTGDEMQTRLLVGADGTSSTVRKAAGFNTLGHSYNQSGVVATLQLRGADENRTAWQRFMKDGPIALLPLDENHSSLVWTTTTEEAKKLTKLSEEEFTDALNAELWRDNGKSSAATTMNKFIADFLGNFQGSARIQQLPPTVTGVVPGSIASFPLAMQIASQMVTHRIALVGDSAHRVHPLAGQGVNLGFADVSELVNILRGAVMQGADVGSLSHLLRYETTRLRHTVPVTFGIDVLNNLYRSTLPPFVLARAIGLQLVDSLPLKSFFMKKARFGI